MIEKMFPQTVSNIIDYDAIKAAAKKYVEDVFVEIVKSFGDNLILQTMDEAHLAEVSKHVAGDSGLSVEDLLSYMNTDNIYRESEFVSDLLTAFPSGVEYLEFEVTGWKFPQVDFAPFSEPERSYNYDGTPVSGAGDDVWMDNAFNGDYVNNLLLSRYKGQYSQNSGFDWHKKSGRRSSWGDAETWMTTGGFGKPASIHINVDEERTVLEENGLSSVENWLGTVANKLPINLYIEINDIFKTNGEDTAGSTNGYRQSFPYAEGEGFCTNDPAMAVSPDVATVTYTVSYANTQLPDVQIELPESETVEDGYSIILPTMTGEYESGGKTWKPTAWDIGEFGDSYTPNANTVAHLIFEEVETYQEITLYLQSGNKRAQNDVTSAFTGDVNSTYCYQLYTDAECTIPWTGYDYSNDYEWLYNGVVIGIQKVSDLPSTTVTSGAKIAYILMDTGSLWLACNMTGSGYMQISFTSLTLRIYPKSQQHYAAYFNYNNLYGNYSLGGNRPVYTWPVGTSGNYKGWLNGYPAVSFVKFLGSAGNELSNVGTISTASNSNNALTVARTNYSGNINVRCVIFTLDTPTFYAWVRTDKTNENMSSGSLNTLYDKSGNTIPYNNNLSYRAIGVMNASGENCSSEKNVLTYSSMLNNNGNLTFSQTYGTISTAKIWYIKMQRNVVVNFGDPVTIPDGFTVDRVMCTKLFVKASSITYSGQVIQFEYPGENIYSEDTDLDLFGVQVNPCIEMFGFSNATNFAGFRLSVDSTRTGYASSVLATNLNSGGFFVKGEATLLSNRSPATYAGYMQQNPMMFRLYTSGGVKPYHFNVPQSIWQFQNGVFSWLGDDTDTTDLAYWYKSAPDICIFLKPIP